MTLVNLTCYGKVYLADTPLRGAKAKANRHIRECPEGEMPWARWIFWYLAFDGAWVSAARGEWLNHHIVPVEVGT